MGMKHQTLLADIDLIGRFSLELLIDALRLPRA
jgi:hypothetical protein